MANPTLAFDTFSSSDCKSIGWHDLTGAYSATNPGGFGAPNVDVSDILYAALTIVLSDGTTVVLSAAQGFYPAFPTTDKTKVFAITSALLGLGTNVNIADWIAYMTYSCSINADGSDPFTTSQYEFISCNSRCCVNKLNAKVDSSSNCEPCDNKALQTYLKAEALFSSIGNSLECDPPLPNNANKDLTLLTDICNGSGCGCNCN